MHIDVYPHKGQYRPGDEILINIELDGFQERESLSYQISILDLEKCIWSKEEAVKGNEMNQVQVTYKPKLNQIGAYGVDVKILEGKSVICQSSTAFDIVQSWEDAPRYGFLSDFYEKDEIDNEDIKQMNKFHISTVQFYDWMYRHDDLIPETDIFEDVLGRKLSLKAVRNKIDLCHQYGMKAVAYGAIYASSIEFFKKHEEWGFYNQKQEAIDFANLFYIMDISENSPWVEHIKGEYKKAITVLDFDGIHMDTYGFPKMAFSHEDSQVRKLNELYPKFIDAVYDDLIDEKDEVSLFFNAVSNWGIEDISKSKLNVAYIEVWDPQERYIHLYQLINRGKELGHKNVVLAAYLESFHPTKSSDREKEMNTFCLASATIFASGGFHLLLGENNGLLADPYYVNYGRIQDEKAERRIRNYYDFFVRYSKLLNQLDCRDCSMTHVGGINDEIHLTNSRFSSYGEVDKVWTIYKELPGYHVLHLINLIGQEDEKWNTLKASPVIQKDIEISILVDEDIKGVYLASPDMEYVGAQSLPYEVIEKERGNYIQIRIPELHYWNMVYIVTSEDVIL